MATKGLVSLLIQAKDDASQAIDAVIKKNAELQKVEKASAASARELTAAEKNLAEAQKLGFKSAKDLLAAIDAKTGRLRVNAATVKQTTAATVAGTQASASHSRAVQNEVNQLRGLGIQAQRVAEQETRLLALRGRLAGVSRAAGVQNLGRAAVGAAPGFSKLQNAAQQLAFGLAGIPGAAGRVISTLATFTVGSGWTLGVVAGITAIVAIWDQFTSGQREAKRAAEETLSALAKANDERTGRAATEARITAERAVTDAALKRDRLQAELAAAQADPNSKRVALLQSQLATAETTLLREQKALAEVRALGSDKAREKQDNEIDLIRQKIDANKETAADLAKLAGLQSTLNAQLASGNLSLEDEIQIRRKLAAISDAQTAITERGAEAAKRRAEQIRAMGDAQRELNLLRAQGPDEEAAARAAIRAAAIDRQVASATELSPAERASLRTLLEQADARREQVRLNDEANDLLERQIELANAADPVYQALLDKELQRLAAFKEALLLQGKLLIDPAARAKAAADAHLTGLGLTLGQVGDATFGVQDDNAEVRQFIDSMRVGLKGALHEFLTTGIQTFESLGQAVQEFGLAIARTLADIISQKAAEKAVDKLFSFLKLAEGGVVTRQGGRPVALDGGGVVRGPGTSTSDSIPALLSNGEGVVTARGVDMLGGAAGIAYINQLALRSHRRVPRFADGGVVGAATQGGGVTQNATLLKVMLQDGMIAEQLESGPAVRAQIRVFEKNRRAIRSALGI